MTGHRDLLSGTEHPRDRFRQQTPTRTFSLQLAATRDGQPVVFRALLVLRDVPLRVDPPSLLEAVQRRVQRAVIHLQDIVGAGSNGQSNSVTVLRPPLQRTHS